MIAQFQPHTYSHGTSSGPLDIRVFAFPVSDSDDCQEADAKRRAGYSAEEIPYRDQRASIGTGGAVRARGR